MNAPRAPHGHRRRTIAQLLGPVAIATTAASAVTPATVAAQDRLVGLRAFALGATFEQVTFGEGGLLQGQLVGQDSLRLRSASQFSLPVTAAVPLGASWTFDVSAIYANGTVTVDELGANGRTGRELTLSGLSDVRARLSGRLIGDGLLVTYGVNAPTGQTELDGQQLSALRTLAAPGLGLGSPPVGSGASATAGLLLARQLGGWGVAIGGAYEYRSTFQPIASLVAGAPSTDFSPGGVARVSAGIDGFLGAHRLNVTASGDFFLEDELRNASDGADALARVQIGPLLGIDAQLQVAAPRLREFVVWTSVRSRGAFARDGITVEGTDATYVDGGLRVGVPVGRRTDVFTALTGRWHSGLDIDEGLPTAAVTAVGATLGLSRRLSPAVSLQPFVRGQIGTVTAGGTATGRPEADFTGFGGGVVLVTRF